jgi:creatinine amidohydrolase
MSLKGVYLEKLSWKEAEEALRGGPVVVVPVGARLKEHGLHLPLNNDWTIAEYLTRRVVEESPVVAVPTIPYGYYPAFTEYPGSVNLGLATFRDTVVDLCRSFVRHGCRRFYVLNTGISTNHALEPARECLAAEGVLMEFTDLRLAGEKARASVRQQPEGTHADEIETSMMLYIAPETVRLERAVRDIHPRRGAGGTGGGLTPDPRAASGVYSPTGAWGDPTLATLEKGRVVVEALVEDILAAIDRVARAQVPGPARR